MSASKPYLSQTFEPSLRSIITGMQVSGNAIMNLPSGKSPSHLNKALGQMASAIEHLRKWAIANGMEIREVPPT